MRQPSPYVRFPTRDLTLRDVLAVDRTAAANERTFLGYIRTTLALLAAGGSLLHFFDGGWAMFAGLSFLAAAVPVFGLGMFQYAARRRHLAPLMSAVDDSACEAGSRSFQGAQIEASTPKPI